VTVSAITADIRIDETALGELSASFKGELVGPGDATYDEYRKVWNGSIDRLPALIARCGALADVLAAVKFARSSGLPVAQLPTQNGVGHRS
jgi:FAD/FMN-containing dehydrogenase